MTFLQTGLARAASSTSYQISRSLRFNSADSAYLNRTPASAGNRKTWTWSGWVKRSALGSFGLFGCQVGAGNPRDAITFATDAFEYTANTGGSAWDVDLVTTQVFRDVSAWYHFVLAVDTTQATSSNRLKMYVNGVQITAFSTATYPSLNADLPTNQAQIHYLGAQTGANYFNGYIADVRFIDGQALTPSSFGQTDSATGVWVPINYTGTYGTNGFYLPFSDNSGTTATTLGKDSSGNGNNWTPNNFSVTAGVGNDSLVDSPTWYGTDTGAGGEVRGNYCTLNPLKIGSNATLANGNLDFSSSTAAGFNVVLGTLGMSSGKWYWEVTATSSASNGFGIATDQVNLSNYLGSDANGWMYYQTALKYNNGSSSSYGASFTTNDVIGFAFDADAGSITAYKNGVSQGVMYSGLAAGTYFPAVSDAGATTCSSTANFGQRPFAYTAPSGFKALCTTNLPTPAIGASAGTLASKNMNVVTYTGNGTATGNTQAITGVGFQPDFSWIKSRSSGTFWHMLNDSVRGANKLLYSNAIDSEGSLTNVFNSFDADGFTVSLNTAYSVAQANANAATYVAWNWKANGAAVTNNSGSISSQVSANTAAGISVVTYTGAAAGTVGHGLGAAPAMIIAKQRSATGDWVTYHRSIGKDGGVALNKTDAAFSLSNYWGSSAPSSTTFGTAPTTAYSNATGNIVAYCFAEVPGFSKFGSFTGNGSSDGPFVYCGFRPRFFMWKRTDGVGSDWVVYDTARSPTNLASGALYPNGSIAQDSADFGDFLSNGVKIRQTVYNASGATYIFAAFAESPFNYSRAR